MVVFKLVTNLEVGTIQGLIAKTLNINSNLITHLWTRCIITGEISERNIGKHVLPSLNMVVFSKILPEGSTISLLHNDCKGTQHFVPTFVRCKFFFTFRSIRESNVIPEIRFDFVCPSFIVS